MNSLDDGDKDGSATIASTDSIEKLPETELECDAATAGDTNLSENVSNKVLKS